MLVKEVEYNDFIKIITFCNKIGFYDIFTLYTKNFKKIKIYTITETKDVPKYIDRIIPISKKIAIIYEKKIIFKEKIENGILFQSYNNFYVLKEKSYEKY